MKNVIAWSLHRLNLLYELSRHVERVASWIRTKQILKANRALYLIISRV